MTANEHAGSPWMSFDPPEYPRLDRDTRADVCVIGAGIAGMTTAYLLTRKGRKVVVLDDGPIGGGMTGRTTAHLMSAIDDRYYEVERLHGVEGARLAAQSHVAAIEAVESIVDQEAIDCDFTRLDGYLFLPPGGDPEDLKREYAAAVRAGVDVNWSERAPIDGFDTGRCLKFARQGQFHPLKYLAGLAEAITRAGGSIFCATHAAEMKDGESVVTDLGHRIQCDQIVVATNAPINDRVAIHTKQAPYMTYVVGARVPKGSVQPALFWDTLDDYHYVRLDKPDGEILIVGGEDHKSGQADDAERRFGNLERWLRERFPGAGAIEYRWAGQVMETQDYLAFAGRNPGDRHTYVITGDSGMGMTHSTIGAIIVTDLVHGAEVPWTKLYDPSRITLKAAPTFARENANVAWQFTDWLRAGDEDSIDSIAPGSGALVRSGIRKVAVYRDASGAVHAHSAVCPHLGCPVAWNPAEKTWDCKCHGSRFDAMGQVINGPANRALDPVDEPWQGAHPPRRPEGRLGA
jgi:glycine/D-amino acid oxidase-like deaminating enzyme/nitrite reductase/ring-hydroxylating ferredoxin subunit